MDTTGLLERLRRQDGLVIELKQVIVAQERHIAELHLQLTPSATGTAVSEPPEGFLQLLRFESCVGLHEDGWLATAASLVFRAPHPGRSLTLEFFLPPAAGAERKIISVETDFAPTTDMTIERDQPARYVRLVPDTMQLPPVLFIRSSASEQPTAEEMRDLGVLLVDISVA